MNDHDQIRNQVSCAFHNFVSSGITVGLQQTTYNHAETGGPLSICVEMFVGNLERNVTVTLASSDDSAVGNFRY